MKVWLVAGLVAFGHQAASETLGERLFKCRQMNADTDRLTCYDQAIDAGERAANDARKGETVAGEWDGNGLTVTRPFHISGPWELRWTSEDGFFAVLKSPSGETIDALAEQSKGGDGHTYVPKGGDYTLEIHGFGEWHAQAVVVSKLSR